METIQSQCDRMAKCLAVSLAFFIPISTTITQIILLLIIVAISGSNTNALKPWKERALWLISHPVGRSILCLLLIFSIGILYSKGSRADAFHMLPKISKIIFIPILLPLFVEEKWRRAAMMAFIAAMILSLVFSTLKNYHLLPSSIPLSRHHNCAFKNHIDTNLLMSIAVFCLGHFLFIRTHYYLKIITVILLLSMTLYILWVSQGRTGYVVFSALWLLFLWQRLTIKQCLMGMGFLILLLGAAYLLPSELQQRIAYVGEELKLYQSGKVSGSVGERLEFMQSSFEIARQRPWFGFGTGGFKEAYAAYAKEHHQNIITTNPHNEYLNIAIQWGLVGLFFFLFFIVNLYKASVLLPTYEKYLLQGVLFGLLVGCTANSLFMDFTPGYFFVLCLSVTLATFSRSSEQRLKIMAGLNTMPFGKIIESEARL